MTKLPWLSEARKHIGQREIKGKKHNNLILRWWEAIKQKFRDDETAWCAAFVGGCLEAVGIQSTRSAMARSYEKWGVPLGLGKAAAVGAVAVFGRGNSKVFGHVAFIVGRDKHGNLLCLGGNQADAVNVKPFARGRLVAVRWPKGVEVPAQVGFATLPLLSSDGKLSTNEA